MQLQETGHKTWNTEALYIGTAHKQIYKLEVKSQLEQTTRKVKWK